MQNEDTDFMLLVKKGLSINDVKDFAMAVLKNCLYRVTSIMNDPRVQFGTLH